MNIFIGIIATITAIYVAFRNLKLSKKYFINIFFSIVSILTSFMLIAGIIPSIYKQNINLFVNIYFALIILINQLFFHYTQLYPRWEQTVSKKIILLSSIPGLVVFLITLLNLNILSKSYVENNMLKFEFGKLYVLYLSTFMLYIIGTFFNFFIRIKNLRNKSFRYQLYYNFMGNHLGALLILTSFIIFPYVFNIYRYQYLGISTASIWLLIINNYALTNEKLLNFKEYYLRLIYIGLVLILTIVPLYFIINAFYIIKVTNQNPTLAISISVILYLVIFNRYIQPFLKNLYMKEFNTLEKRFNVFVKELIRLEESEGDPNYWDKFFSSTVDALEYLFNANDGWLYFYESDQNTYILSHYIGNLPKMKKFDSKSSLIDLCKNYKSVISQSLFYTDSELANYYDTLKILKDNSFEIIMPCFNQNNELIAILFLGKNINKRPYTYHEIEFMELFRTRFSNALNDALQIEKIKEDQKNEYNSKVINIVKSRTLPKKLDELDTFKVSALYVNNSTKGGEIYLSKVLPKNNYALLIADYSYADIDSAILSLEIYSSFKSLSDTINSPEKILQMINWVISTSNYSNVYVPSFCLVYDEDSLSLKYVNATYNPCILYDASIQKYIKLNTKGVPIGVDRDYIYESNKYNIKTWAMGCLYSSGIINLINQNNEHFSPKNLENIILNNLEKQPYEIIKIISNELQSFNKEKIDEDICIIVFKCGKFF